MMTKYCKYCYSKIETDIYSANYMLFCPECLKLSEAVGEYGYGNPYPVDCYMGFHKIGSIESINEEIILKRYKEDDLVLEKDDYSVIMKRASAIIEAWLKG